MAKAFHIRAATAMLALTATIGTTAPAMADRGYRDGGYYSGGYDGYERGDYYRGDRGYYRDARYGYDNDGRDYRGGHYRRCRGSDGATGTIVGAIAGGLIGNSVAGRRGDRTAGTIIGGAVGALAGRAIDKGSSSRC